MAKAHSLYPHEATRFPLAPARLAPPASPRHGERSEAIHLFTSTSAGSEPEIKSPYAKRLLDLLLATLLLILLAPLLAAIAAALRATGAQTAVYRQRRAGAGGKPFHLLKFRTMKAPDHAAFRQAVPGDPRVTPLGRLLRRTSLDELPQLLNVLAGDMSLVGPRPHAPATTVAGNRFEDAAKFYRLRHRVRPGITGLAQIRGQRGATFDLRALERRVSSDLEYIESWSLWLDLSILLRTIPAILRPRNAY